jgi:hypothetical protein
VIGATSGNLAALDANGNLTDSGSKVSDFVTGTKLVSNTENGLIKAGGGGAVKTIAGNPGCLYINTPSDSTIKAGTNDNFVAGIGSQHKSVFYGLAKAAGDTTQSSSSNAVGKYTAGAMDKILAMLGVSDLIAPHESTAIASRAYAIGQAFMYSGKLYKATAAISSGDAIVPGTNCATTYLVDLI